MHLIFATIFTILSLSFAIIFEDKKSKVWNTVMGIGLAIFWTGTIIYPLPLISFGLLVFMVGAIGLCKYQITNENIPLSFKSLYILLVIFSVGPFLFRIMHWPYTNMLLLLSIIPILFLLIAFVIRKVPEKGVTSGLIVFSSLCFYNFFSTNIL